MSFSLHHIDCPNQDHKIIPVEFLVLHYTAMDLTGTLDIFQDAARSVSSHLVIDSDGTVYSLVDCLQGLAHRAWHAGRSHYVDDEGEWSEFNDFSIGIELVNLNGNLFPFAEAQYQSLAAVTLVLKALYPALTNPNRILGHEHIAGYRGKIDPGTCFDWKRFWQMCYPDAEVPERHPVCPENLIRKLNELAPFAPSDFQGKTDYWVCISSLMETAVGLLLKGDREC